MGIYDKIIKMLGIESPEEKLYKVLNTDDYKVRPYDYTDLGEGMAVISETMWGWWKHRFLINHNTKCAYEFINSDQKLVTVTQDDIVRTSEHVQSVRTAKFSQLNEAILA